MIRASIVACALPILASAASFADDGYRVTRLW
jgi:hypothetical protein